MPTFASQEVGSAHPTSEAVMNKFIRLTALTVCVADMVMLTAAVRGDTALAPDQIRQGEARQQQIKTQTQQVANQLGAIVEEFKRNGLDGADVQVLEAIRSVLDKLGETEMKKVIDALQEARSDANPSASQRAFVGAVANQKNIVVQMRALLLEYQRQQALYDLSLRLAALAERENGNLKAAVELAKSAGNRTGVQYEDNQKASLQIQQAEQQALKEEVTPLLAKLQTLAKEAEETARNRLAKAMEQLETGGLRPAMDSAVEDLRNAALYRAAGNEKTVRDQLRELARQVAPPKDRLAALEAAAKELEKAIEAQKVVIDDTKKSTRDRVDMTEAEKKQADLVDKTDAIKKDLQAIAPDASNELKNSQDAMQEARASLTDRKRDEAVKNENQALAKLEVAKKALQDEIARSEPKDNAKDKLAAAKELQERTKELIKKEEQIKSATAANEQKAKELKALAPKQGALEDATKELQHDAAAQSPEASQAMADAANQMDKSQKNLEKAQSPKTAQEAQAAAVAALKQADEQLGNQIKEMEKAKEELAELKDAREKVAKLIEDQQKTQVDTAKAAQKPDGQPAAKGEEKPADPKQLGEKQAQLAKQTDQLKAKLPEADKAAAAPLDDAGKNMADAKKKLDANDPKDAAPPQQEAVANLFKAKKALDKKIGDLQKELGEKPQDPNAMANAAEKIAELQKKTEQATDKLNGDKAKAEKTIADEEKEIAKALGEMDNADEKSPVAQAEKAAEDAAQQLADGKPQDAAKSMAKAQEGMKQAMQKGQPDKGGQKDLPKLAQKQADLQKALEQMQQQKPDGQQAAKDFEKTAEEANKLAADDQGQLPPSAQGALQQAAQALSDAMAQAMNGDKPGAQQSAGQAQSALSQAAAAMALAKAGLSGQMPGKGKGQGKGQQPGEGEGEGEGQADKPGEGDKPGQGQGQAKGKGKANEEVAKGGSGNRQDTNSNVQNGGPRGNEKSAGQFLALPKRDRAAITQSQNDKYPQEYSSQIEQYLKNLADQEEK